MSSFSMDTRSMSSSSPVNSLVKNRLLKIAPDTDEPHVQFIHTIDLTVLDTMLHDSPDLVIYRTEIWAVWRPQVGCKKVWHFLTQQLNCCTCAVRCAGALSCWNKVVTRHFAYRWQQCNVIMTSWSSIEAVSMIYHQNFLFCNNNEINTCNADLVSLKKCMRLHFFKVVRQQTSICEVGNSIMCL